jgi:hypothetical protein
MRIDEIVSDKIYHYTGIYNAEKIVTGRGFALTASPGTDVERAMQKGNRFYYLSTTRSKVGDYTLHNSYRTGVVFNLNGRWFNDRYKGAAVDYWESYWIAQRRAGVTDRGREMEDRVFSYEPTIPLPQNMGEVITSIHVLFEEIDERFVIPLRRLLLGAKKNGIPIFLYDDKQAFLLQDTRRTKDISSLIPDLKKIEPDAYQRQSRDSLKPYRELYHKRDREHLSKDAKKRLSNIIYDSFGDAPRSFSADIHNARTSDREIWRNCWRSFARKTSRPQNSFSIFSKPSGKTSKKTSTKISPISGNSPTRNCKKVRRWCPARRSGRSRAGSSRR